MRVFLLSVVTSLLAASSGWAQRAPGEPALRWHGVGTRQLADNRDAQRLRTVLEEATTRRLVDYLFDRLAASPARLLPAGAIPAGLDTRPSIRPFLEEFTRAESYLDLHIRDNQASELVVAVRQDDAKYDQWRTDWTALVKALGAAEPQATAAANGVSACFEAAKPGSDTVCRLARNGSWTLLAFGARGSAGLAALAQRVSKGAPPAAADGPAWCEVEADLPALARLLGWPAAVTWPRATVQVAGRSANLRAQARLVYAQPLELPLGSWRIPTNTIREPLVGFTAVQGIRPWLLSATPLRELGLPALPNQVFGWAQRQVPYQVFYSWEMPEPGQTILSVTNRVSAWLTNHWPWLSTGELSVFTDPPRLVWSRIPIAAPFITPGAAQDPGFVYAGIFTQGDQKTNVPPELYAQILGRTNLVYYDWEITEPRVEGWLRIKDIYWMLKRYATRGTNEIGRNWLLDTNVVRHLGNSVTEVAQVSARELQARRTSAVGLTAFELVALMRWIDDPEFPRLSRPAVIVARRASRASAPSGSAANRQ